MTANPLTTAAERFALVVDQWFDGERHFARPATLRIQRGRVAAIDEGDDGAALLANGWPLTRGAFLMPGLVDAHMHLFLDGAPTDAAERAAHLRRPVAELTEAARQHARHALSVGVTLVRDAGDQHGINHRLRDEARASGAWLPHIRSGGLGIKRARRYGAFMATDVDDARDIEQSVRRLARDNDEIKLILTGIIDFEAGAVTDEPQFDIASASLAVRIAHQCGRKVFAHCSGARGLEVAIAAGVDSIEHGFFLNRELLARMRDRALAWTPTFCPVHFQWARPDAVGWPPATVAHLRRILDMHADNLRIAHDLGVTVLLGTDAGSMGVVHGDAVFDEIERFVEAGLSTRAALSAATSVPRRHFDDADPLLAPGARFDAVMLARSPFDSLAALRSPSQVWLGGRALR